MKPHLRPVAAVVGRRGGQAGGVVRARARAAAQAGGGARARRAPHAARARPRAAAAARLLRAPHVVPLAAAAAHQHLQFGGGIYSTGRYDR